MSQAEVRMQSVLRARAVDDQRKGLAKGKGLEPGDRRRLAAITMRAARVRDSRGTRPAY